MRGSRDVHLSNTTVGERPHLAGGRTIAAAPAPSGMVWSPQKRRVTMTDLAPIESTAANEDQWAEDIALFILGDNPLSGPEDQVLTGGGR
jgi:hypothetical protein